MPRNDLLLRVTAVLVGIAALALAAATIGSPIDPGGSGGIGTGDGSVSSPPSASEPTGGVPTFLEYLFYAVVVLAALAVAWYLIAHRRDAVKTIAAVLAASFVLALVAYLFVNFSFPSEGDGLGVPGLPGSGNFSGTPGEEDGKQAPTQFGPLLTVIAAVTAIFVGALLLNRDGGGETLGPQLDDDPATDPSDAAAVGAAAGRAADRITTGDDVDNEVYRAWREMTALLSVDRPETSTPGEFAAAAVDAGLDRDHVEELTSLFEDVRYGHEETTAEMESRAVAILERIEAEYADDAVADRRGDGR